MNKEQKENLWFCEDCNLITGKCDKHKLFDFNKIIKEIFKDAEDSWYCKTVKKAREELMKRLEEKREPVLNMRMNTEEKLRTAIIKYFEEENKLIGEEE